MKIVCFSLLAFLQFAVANPESDSLIFGIEKKTVAVYSMAVYTIASFHVEYQWWWKGNYHHFKQENDGFWNNYSLGVDKIGHFYTSFLYFNITYEFLRWATFDESSALCYAVLIPAFNALSIEIGDGFSTYAFSNADFFANSLGIGFGVLQK
ncbi:MAG: DUF2279 domain-containing protein, partial [Bacteroidota bacterium]